MILKCSFFQEILNILDEEKGRDFSTVHSLFVIIITRGDRNGIYGTTGELIEYWKITTRFDQVPSLKGKPKIFIIDDCEIGILIKKYLLTKNYPCFESKHHSIFYTKHS